MTVSMATWASWMSTWAMMLLSVARSASLPAVTSNALLRSSARMEMFSLSSWPMRARVSGDCATRVRAGEAEESAGHGSQVTRTATGRT